MFLYPNLALLTDESLLTEKILVQYDQGKLLSAILIDEITNKISRID